MPLVKRWDYLGAILSYTAYASDTVQRRVKAADHAFSKLRQVLGSRRSLSLAQRLFVYDACVQSTLLYGILAVGVTPTAAKLIHYMTMRHLRFIANSPRHITRESNVELCTRLGRPLPLGALHCVWERKCRAWQSRREQLLLQDILHTVPSYPDLVPTLTSLAFAGLGLPVRMRQSGSVRHATEASRMPQLSGLLTHCARPHLPPTRDAKPGSWECAHCHLAYHIERGACLQFDESRLPAQVPHINRPALTANILQNGLEALCDNRQLCSDLVHTCAMCGRHVDHAFRMSQHIMRCHNHVYALASTTWNHAQLQLRGYTNAAKCPYCEAQVKALGQHSCPVLCQLACLHACAHAGITSTHENKPPRQSRPSLQAGCSSSIQACCHHTSTWQ